MFDPDQSGLYLKVLTLTWPGIPEGFDFDLAGLFSRVLTLTWPGIPVDF